MVSGTGSGGITLRKDYWLRTVPFAWDGGRESRKNVKCAWHRGAGGHRDGFGRLLAYVIADGKNVNLEMVRQGWSTFWKKYSKGRLAAAFEAAEQEARAAKRGLWGMASPP